jgi:hypothetical protein
MMAPADTERLKKRSTSFKMNTFSHYVLKLLPEGGVRLGGRYFNLLLMRDRHDGTSRHRATEEKKHIIQNEYILPLCFKTIT